MGRIVVGVDGSENSLLALRWALEEADLRGAPLEAVIAWQLPYVGDVGFGLVPGVSTSTLEESARETLEKALAAVCPEDQVRARIERTVVAANAAAALLDAAKGADLLVVGSRGHGGFRGLLLGSVSTQCVHHAPCPVVVLRSHE
jgi:nucleotide-binding universal stress UspA family protein